MWIPQIQIPAVKIPGVEKIKAVAGSIVRAPRLAFDKLTSIFRSIGAAIIALLAVLIH